MEPVMIHVALFLFQVPTNKLAQFPSLKHCAIPLLFCSVGRVQLILCAKFLYPHTEDLLLRSAPGQFASIPQDFLAEAATNACAAGEGPRALEHKPSTIKVKGLKVTKKTHLGA